MAGAGYKLFNTGDVLLASEVNTYLMQQTVMSFADSTARTTALSGVLAEGMVSYLRDTNVVEIYNGSAWASLDDPNAIQNSIVDAKGDLIAASANDTPARLAVGNNGETLVADSSATTGLIWQGNYAAGKNKIINGDFGIWQRGTSFSGLGNGAYWADRFGLSWSAGGASNTVSQQTFTPGTAPVAGYEGQFFGRVAATSGGASTVLGLHQKVEDVRTLANRTFVVSFWAKADSARTATLYMIQDFGSGGSGAVTNTTTFSITTSWTRFTYTATMPSVSGKTIGTGSYFYLGLEYAAGQASGSPQLDTWGWQLEAGSTATAFQTATGTIQGELAACQRYYYRSGQDNLTTPGAYCRHAFGYTTSTTNAFITLFLPTTMRTNPASVDFANIQVQDLTGSSFTATAITLDSATSGNKQAGLNCTIAGATASRMAAIQNNNNTGGYVAISAEL